MFWASPWSLWASTSPGTNFATVLGDGDEVIASLKIEKNLQSVFGDGDEIISALLVEKNLQSIFGDGDELISALNTPKFLSSVFGDGDGILDIDTSLVPDTGLYYSKNGVLTRVGGA